MWPFKRAVAPQQRRRRVARVSERYSTDLLQTELGAVADISGYGVRVRAGKQAGAAVGQARPLTLRWAEYRLCVKCRLVRVTRNPQGGYDLGFTFVDPSPRLKAALEHLGQFGFVPGADCDSTGGPEGECRSGGSSKKAAVDHYRTLGVGSDATAAEIRTAYYRLARKHHPDAAGDSHEAREFQRVTEAYRVLRDPDHRREYDEARGASVAAA